MKLFRKKLFTREKTFFPKEGDFLALSCLSVLPLLFLANRSNACRCLFRLLKPIQEYFVELLDFDAFPNHQFSVSSGPPIHHSMLSLLLLWLLLFWWNLGAKNLGQEEFGTRKRQDNQDPTRLQDTVDAGQNRGALIEIVAAINRIHQSLVETRDHGVRPKGR